MTENCDTEFTCGCGMACVSGSVDLNGKTYVPAADPVTVRGPGELLLEAVGTSSDDNCCCEWEGSTYFYAEDGSGGVSYDDKLSVALNILMCSQDTICATLIAGPEYNYIGTPGGSYGVRDYCPGEYHTNPTGPPTRPVGFPEFSFNAIRRDDPCEFLSVSAGGDDACKVMCVVTGEAQRVGPEGDYHYVPHYRNCYEHDAHKHCPQPVIQSWPWKKAGVVISDPVRYFDDESLIPIYETTWYHEPSLYNELDLPSYCEIDAVDLLAGCLYPAHAFYRPQDWWVVSDAEWSTTPGEPPAAEETTYCFTWCGDIYYRTINTVDAPVDKPNMLFKAPCGCSNTLIDVVFPNTTTRVSSLSGVAGSTIDQAVGASEIHLGALRYRFELEYAAALCVDSGDPQGVTSAFCDSGAVACPTGYTLACDASEAHCVDGSAVCGEGTVICVDDVPQNEEYELMPYVMSTEVPDVALRSGDACAKRWYCVERTYGCPQDTCEMELQMSWSGDVLCRDMGNVWLGEAKMWRNGEKRIVCSTVWDQTARECTHRTYINESSHSQHNVNLLGGETIQFLRKDAAPHNTHFTFKARAGGYSQVNGDGHSVPTFTMMGGTVTGKVKWDAAEVYHHSVVLFGLGGDTCWTGGSNTSTWTYNADGTLQGPVAWKGTWVGSVAGSLTNTHDGVTYVMSWRKFKRGSNPPVANP